MRRASCTCSMSTWTVSGAMRNSAMPYMVMKRGLLCRPQTLGLIVGRLASDARDGNPTPRALPVGILGFIERLSIGNRHGEAGRQRECTDQAAVKHGCPPFY